MQHIKIKLYIKILEMFEISIIQIFDLFALSETLL